MLCRSTRISCYKIARDEPTGAIFAIACEAIFAIGLGHVRPAEHYHPAEPLSTSARSSAPGSCSSRASPPPRPVRRRSWRGLRCCWLSGLFATVFAALGGGCRPPAASWATSPRAWDRARAAPTGWSFLAGVVVGAPVVCLIGASYVAPDHHGRSPARPSRPDCSRPSWRWRRRAAGECHGSAAARRPAGRVVILAAAGSATLRSYRTGRRSRRMAGCRSATPRRR